MSYNNVVLSSKILATIASAVVPTLGPSFVDQVIVNHTNDILISNSGYSILKSLNIDGPIGKYILNCAKELNNLCGDGCTTFIILLDALLKESIYYSSYLSHHKANYNDNLSSIQLNKLSIAIRDIQTLWYPKIIYPMVSEWSMKCSANNIEITMRKILNSSLCSSFGPGTSQYLANIIIEWIKASLPLRDSETISGSGSNSNDNFFITYLINAVNNLKDFFPVLFVPKAMLQDTKVISNSYILKNSFARTGTHTYVDKQLQKPLQTNNYKYKRFIVIIGLLTIDFKKTKDLYGGSKNVEIKGIVSRNQPSSLDDPSSTTTRFNNSSNVTNNWWKYPTVRAFQYTQILKKRGINLILCTEGINDVWKNAFTHFGILAVQFVEPEDAKFICYKAGIQPIYNLTLDTCMHLRSHGYDLDAINNTPTKQSNMVEVGQLEEFRQVIFGNKYHVVLEHFVAAGKQNTKCLDTAQLLLRAPSDGIGEQYRNCLKRSLSLLKSWLGATTTTNSDEGLMSYPKYFVGPNLYEHRLRCWLHHIVLWLNDGGECDEGYNFWMTKTYENDAYKEILSHSRSKPAELKLAFKILLGGYNTYFFALKYHNMPSNYTSNFNSEYMFNTLKDFPKIQQSCENVFDSVNTKVSIFEYLLNSWQQLLKIDIILPSRSTNNNSVVNNNSTASASKNNNRCKFYDDASSSGSDEDNEE